MTNVYQVLNSKDSQNFMENWNANDEALCVANFNLHVYIYIYLYINQQSFMKLILPIAFMDKIGPNAYFEDKMNWQDRFHQKISDLLEIYF